MSVAARTQPPPSQPHLRAVRDTEPSPPPDDSAGLTELDALALGVSRLDLSSPEGAEALSRWR